MDFEKFIFHKKHVYFQIPQQKSSVLWIIYLKT